MSKPACLRWFSIILCGMLGETLDRITRFAGETRRLAVINLSCIVIPLNSLTNLSTASLDEK